MKRTKAAVVRSLVGLATAVDAEGEQLTPEQMVRVGRVRRELADLCELLTSAGARRPTAGAAMMKLFWAVERRRRHRVRVWNFNGAPARLNTMLRQHYRDRKREKDAWKLMLLAVAGNREQRPQRAWVRIDIMRKKLQDPDNVVVKCLLDAMVATGWLKDDSPKHLMLEVEEHQGPEVKTMIQWEEL